MAEPEPSSSRRTRVRLVALVLANVAITAGLWLSPAAEFERGVGLRALYALRGELRPPDDVVIVGMDSASAQTLGVPERPDRWPRSLHARLVSGLAASGARVIGFDLLFAQPREGPGDAAFAQALRQAGNVVLAETVTRDLVRAADGSVAASADRRVRPLALFAESASATAPFMLSKTRDGVFEFWPRVPTLGDLPSLPLVMAQRMPRAGATAEEGRAAPRRGWRPAWIAAEPPLRTLNLYGPLGTVTTIPYARALELVADPAAAAEVFAGKAVLVGYSEWNQSRQIDAHPTPFSTPDGVDVSGVELCATALGNLLEGAWLRRPGEALTLALLGLHAGLLALPWGLARTRTALLANLAQGLAYAGLAHVAFSAAFLWLPVVLPLAFAIPIAGALGIAAHHRDSLRRRAELERALELGIPRAAMERIAAALGSDGRGKTVFAVCLCSDIVSYTTLSESLSPAAARDVLNRYYARFIPVVEAHGGYASDLVGDSVMSLWIADARPERAVAQACRAALELDRVMNAGSREEGALPTRLGLHCGPIYFGEVGGGGRRELRAVGDIVNTSSRIQGANKYLHTGVLASRAVAERFAGGPFRPVGRFLVAGKGQALELVQLVREPLPDEAMRSFSAGLEAFAAGHFVAAMQSFEAARAAGDAGPSAFYLGECRRLAARPPAPGWSGAASLPGK